MTAKPGETLEQRLLRIEDHLAIYQLISAYGAAADSCNMDAMLALWHEDGEYAIGGLGNHKGHQGVRNALNGEYHQMLVTNGSGHVNSIPHVVVDGDRAVATNFGTLFLWKDGEFILERLASARWDLVRDRGSWKIMKRTTEPLHGTNEKAKDLLWRAGDKPAAV